MAWVVEVDDPRVSRLLLLVLLPEPLMRLPFLSFRLGASAFAFRLRRWGFPMFLGYCATCISGKAPPSSKSAMERGTKSFFLLVFRSAGVNRENSAAALHRCSYAGAFCGFCNDADTDTAAVVVILLSELVIATCWLDAAVLVLLLLLFAFDRIGAGRNRDAIRSSQDSQFTVV